MFQGVRRYRWRELQLLILPAVFMLTGMTVLILVDSNTKNVSLPTIDSLVPAIGVIGALLVMHILLTILLPQADQVLFPIVGLLSVLGVLMALRLGPALTPPVDSLGSKQLLWLLLGLVACLATILATRRGLLWVRRYKYTFAAFGILLVAISLVHVFTSHVNFDSPTHDELNLPGPGGGIPFQPSELLKICLVIFFAAYVAENREILGEGGPRIGFISVPPLKQFGPLLLMLLIALVLFVGLRELGLALLIFGIFLSMLYLGSGRILYVVWGVVLFGGGAFLCYKLFTYVQARVVVVGVDCNSTDPATQKIILGPAYQVCQGLIAIGSGGVFGTGLGLGSPTVVPAVQTDLIFSAIGEEFGLLGIMGLLGLYIMLVHRGFRIAAHAKSAFNQLLAGGLTAIFAIQTMIIIAGNLKLFPLTGIPLPFITYGGSSLIANYIIIGLLLRISATENA